MSNAIISISLLGFEQTLDCEQIKAVKSYFVASGHMVNKKINLDHHEVLVLRSFIMACKVTLSILSQHNCSTSICLPRWSLQCCSRLVMAFIFWY